MEQLKLTNYLTPEERKALHQKNDWYASLEILHTWAWIAAAFALAGLFPNPLTILIALFVLGGKQLACAIIMHDASHYSLFNKNSVNDWVGKWFGAYPILNNMESYRPYHVEHHLKTGTDHDPDLGLTTGYPTSKKSMTRKFIRDLTGVTGIKATIGLLAMHLGILAYHMGGKVSKVEVKGSRFQHIAKAALKNLSGPFMANLFLFLLLWSAGSAWLYVLWVIAYLTTFQFCLRVRSMAEHSVVPNRLDPYQNTRTTYANFLEKMLFAPHHVNYHTEHHLLMAVPCYHLPKMHKMLRERGFYEKGILEKGYLNIVKLAIGVAVK
ncbi:MAG: fatty acid desaturase family protein [Flammeovirgaceae bacterium]